MSTWETFVAAVMSSFGFLESEFGFTFESSQKPFVIFTSTSLEVLIYYGIGRHSELDVSIKRRNADPKRVPPLSLMELMLLTDKSAAEEYKEPFSIAEADLESEVRKLSTLFRRYAANTLAGNLAAFTEIERLRRKREAELLSDENSAQRLNGE